MRLHSCRKEPETIGWLESSVAPGDVVYDIGANVGAYALVVDRHTNGESIVYAFEPGFANFAQLCRNILLNGCQSRIVPFAVSLSDATGMASFHYSSIGPGAAMHTVGQPTGRTEYTQPVLTYRLDDFVEQFGILPPNHIKLDVDGSELAILHGAERLLSSDRLRTLLVEHPVGHDGALGITAFLEQHGLRRLSTHRHGTQTTDAANSVFGRSHPSPPGF
jgi:FkbM family methyltransferase